MVSQDLGFQLKELNRRVILIEKFMSELDKEIIAPKSDWDNTTLSQKWKISIRTAANYRKLGLMYYKRGGRIFYTPESREKFVNSKKLNDGK